MSIGFTSHGHIDLAQVELLKLFLGQLLDSGCGHEAMLILGGDQLDIFQVGRLLDLKMRFRMLRLEPSWCP